MDAAAAGAVPGPLHQPRLGVQLRLERARADLPGAVLRLRRRRERVPVHVPRPLLGRLVPGTTFTATCPSSCASAASRPSPSRCRFQGNVSQFMCLGRFSAVSYQVQSPGQRVPVHVPRPLLGGILPGTVFGATSQPPQRFAAVVHLCQQSSGRVCAEPQKACMIKCTSWKSWKQAQGLAKRRGS